MNQLNALFNISLIKEFRIITMSAFRSTIYLLEKIIFYFGLSPVKYIAIESRYVYSDILYIPILKFIILNTLFFYLTYCNHLRTEGLVGFNLRVLSKLVWFVYEIVQFVELKSKKKSYCEVMNDILQFESSIEDPIMINDLLKLKLKIKRAIIGFCIYQFFCCWLFIHSIIDYNFYNPKISAYLYYNVYILILVVQTGYMIALLEILSMYFVKHVVLIHSSKIDEFILIYSKFKRLITKFTKLYEMQLIMMLLAVMFEQCCSTYMIYEKYSCFTTFKKKVFERQLVYVFFDNLSLFIVLYLCGRYHKYEDQVNNTKIKNLS